MNWWINEFFTYRKWMNEDERASEIFMILVQNVINDERIQFGFKSRQLRKRSRKIQIIILVGSKKWILVSKTWLDEISPEFAKLSSSSSHLDQVPIPIVSDDFAITAHNLMRLRRTCNYLHNLWSVIEIFRNGWDWNYVGLSLKKLGEIWQCFGSKSQALETSWYVTWNKKNMAPIRLT